MNNDYSGIAYEPEIKKLRMPEPPSVPCFIHIFVCHRLHLHYLQLTNVISKDILKMTNMPLHSSSDNLVAVKHLHIKQNSNKINHFVGAYFVTNRHTARDRCFYE